MDKQLKCFVACAFGRPEIDNLFKNVIAPTLKELNIKPLRVDKINHNKNIDLKIVELIRDCDFGISDLTFARPSVYYEAGYLHGLNKEVIFTVRNDHFKPKDADTNGNEKIHFDLITKNIIGWSSKNLSFQKQLKSRIKLIAKPLFSERDKIQKTEIEERQFDSLSLNKKLEMLKKYSKEFLKTKGYKIEEEHERYFIALKKDGAKKKVVLSFTYDNLTFRQLSDFSLYSWGLGKVANVEITQQSSATILFNVLKPIRVSTIQKALPNCQMTINKKEFELHESLSGRAFKYVFFDNIRSQSDYKLRQIETGNM